MPAEPLAGVPARRPAEDNVTPPGNAPVAVNVGAGAPEAVTVNVPAAATVKVVVAALVIMGAVEILSVSDGSGARELAELAQVILP